MLEFATESGDLEEVEGASRSGEEGWVLATNSEVARGVASQAGVRSGDNVKSAGFSLNTHSRCARGGSAGWKTCSRLTTDFSEAFAATKVESAKIFSPPRRPASKHSLSTR